MASLYKNAAGRRNAALDAIAARLNSGRIEIRTATRPANITDASAGTLLGTLNYGATAFAAASAGSASANAITSDTDADASGDAAYFREYQNGGADTAAEAEGNAGESGDSPDMVFDNKTIVAGGTIAISSLSISIAES